MGKAKTNCSIEGCDKPHLSRGWCLMHYRRWDRHGDPMRSIATAQEYVESDVLGYSGDGCLIWPLSRTVKGYGHGKLEGKGQSVHRYVCRRVHGEPPTRNHQAAHSCGKGSLGCINPHHLSWKTPTENCADRLVHGTHTRGEKQPRSKLTGSEVEEIRSLSGQRSHRVIAEMFGVSRTTVWGIMAGRRWSYPDTEVRA